MPESSVAEPPFLREYALVGELVLTASALDHQLTQALIDVLHIAESALLFPMLSTIEIGRKLEILKARASHIPASKVWKETILGYVKKLEKVQRARNVAAHLKVKIEGHRISFVPTDAARILKGLEFDPPAIGGVAIDELREALHTAQTALAEGENIKANFAEVNRRLKEKRASRDK